jgi:hypothetical protein
VCVCLCVCVCVCVCIVGAVYHLDSLIVDRACVSLCEGVCTRGSVSCSTELGVSLQATICSGERLAMCVCIA